MSIIFLYTSKIKSEFFFFKFLGSRAPPRLSVFAPGPAARLAQGALAPRRRPAESRKRPFRPALLAHLDQKVKFDSRNKMLFILVLEMTN